MADDGFETPIFIQNFNQVSHLRKQIAWLLGAGYRNVIVIDNASTYPPLLRYYDEMTASGAIRLLRRPRNDGRRALWREPIRERFGVHGAFVFTSSDIVPDDGCPADVVAHLAACLHANPQMVKVGLGLRIDDLPARYKHRREVLVWEGQFWRAPVARGLFLASIDATFALYRPDEEHALGPALRTGWPYLARHEPWYSDSANPTEEELNYAATIAADRGFWSRDRVPPVVERMCGEIASGAPTLVHLACGSQKFPGWVNLDRDPAVGADITFDLEHCGRRPLPIPGDSVDAFFMPRAFAAIQGTLPMFRELYRVAKANARFVIRLAHPGPARTAPRWSPDNFMGYGQPARAAVDDAYRADWRVTRVKLVVDPRRAGSASDAEVIGGVGVGRDVVEEMIVELQAIKPPRPRDPRALEVPALTVSRSPVDLESAF